jgi:hypothetical protein
LDESKIQDVQSPGFMYSREKKLEEAIKQAIEILKETRKSIKSKKLAELRKRLTQVLIESR